MNFRFFAVFLWLLALNHNSYINAYDGMLSGDSGSNSSYGIRSKGSPRNNDHIDYRPAYCTDRRITCIEDLTLEELYELPAEYHQNPRYIAHKQNLENIKYEQEAEKAYIEQALAQYRIDAERERVEALRKAKQVQDREQYQKNISQVLSKDTLLAAYCNLYQNDLNLQEATAAERHAAVQKKRKKAFSAYNHSCDAWKEKSYKILDKAQKFLNSQSVKVSDYAKMYGNKIQRLLHKEFVMIIHETADMRYVDDEYAKDRESVANTLMRFVETGEFYNRNGSLGKAFSSADFCWGLLDCYGYILSSGLDATTNLFQITVAASKGVVRGCVNFNCKVSQPIRSVEELIDQVAYLRDATWEHLKFAHEERTKNIHKLHEKILKDEYDLKTGKATRWDLLHRDMAFFKEDLGPTIQRVHTIIEKTRQLQKDDVLYGVEKIAEAGTEMFLTNQAISGFGQLFGNSANVLENSIDAGNGLNKFHNLPLNGQTLQAVISYEAAMEEVRVTAPIIGAAGVALEEALEDASYVLPLFLAKNNGGAPKIPKWLAKVPRPNGDILNIKQLSKADEAIFSKKYDGVCSYDGVPIYFRYDHNWNGDINYKSELGGMHQDILGHIESHGLIYKSQELPEKFYEGYAYSQGQWHKKSWFPQKWLVDEVMQSVFETIKNPNHLRRTVGDVTTLEHKRLSGVIIRVVFNNKTGHCFSFYPRL